MKTLNKNGDQLLFLPAHRKAARSALRLYPAQTWKGKALKLAVNFALQAGIPLPLSEASPPDFDFSAIRWLVAPADIVARIQSANTGVFAGNSNAAGRRYLYLFCDKSGCPVVLAKAGFTPHAREKVDAERSFLLKHAELTGVSSMLGELVTPDCCAILLPFLAGKCPQGAALNTPIFDVLASWIHPSERIELRAIPDWRLISEDVGSPELDQILVHPVVGHGDFAPWNVIVDSSGRWQVIDWERGTDRWVPGWDWFHYTMQTGLLVEKLSADKLLEKVISRIHSTNFQNYALMTGIDGIEEGLLRGYLLYANNVLKQTEGKATIEDLARWARRRM